MTKEVADFLIRIKNAYLAQKKQVVLPYSRLKHEMAKILVAEGLVEKADVVKEERGRKSLEVFLRYPKREPALTVVKIISKPGLKVYLKKGEIKKVLGGVGVMILSTSKGLMTGEQARKKGLGGEAICEVW